MTIVAIDGNNLVCRSFFRGGFAPEAPQNFGALFATLDRLNQLSRTYRTDQVVIAWDSGRTFRHDLYPPYKAHRPEKPESLSYQLANAQSFFAAIGITSLVYPGFEADDILASIAYQYGSEAVIYTSDHDLLQVVGSGAAVDFGKAVISTTTAVYEIYGVYPHMIKEYKALVGDRSDNVPGVVGIGPVTARRLINRFRTIEAMLVSSSDLIEAGDREQRNLRLALDQTYQLRLFRDLFVLKADLDIPTPTKIPYTKTLYEEAYRWVTSN